MRDSWPGDWDQAGRTASGGPGSGLGPTLSRGSHRDDDDVVNGAGGDGDSDYNDDDGSDNDLDFLSAPPRPILGGQGAPGALGSVQGQLQAVQRSREDLAAAPDARRGSVEPQRGDPIAFGGASRGDPLLRQQLGALQDKRDVLRKYAGDAAIRHLLEDRLEGRWVGGQWLGW